MSYWDLVEPYWDRISVYDGPAVFLTQFAEAPEPSGHLFAAHFARSEIGNGGMHPLFWNATGVLVPEAISGFPAPGLDILAEQLGQAADLLGPVYPRVQAKRQEILETMAPDIFEGSDELFFAHLDSFAPEDAFERAADAYAKRHIS